MSQVNNEQEFNLEQSFTEVMRKIDVSRKAAPIAEKIIEEAGLTKLKIIKSGAMYCVRSYSDIELDIFRTYAAMQGVNLEKMANNYLPNIWRIY